MAKADENVEDEINEAVLVVVVGQELEIVESQIELLAAQSHIRPDIIRGVLIEGLVSLQPVSAKKRFEKFLGELPDDKNI